MSHLDVAPAHRARRVLSEDTMARQLRALAVVFGSSANNNPS